MPKAPPEHSDRSSRFPDGFRILQGRQEYVTYLSHSSIRVWPFDAPCAFDSHYHSAVEIILVTAGHIVYTLPDRAFTVSKDEILMLPPGCHHAMEQPEGASRVLFLFEPHVFQSLRDLTPYFKQFTSPVYLTAASPLLPDITALLTEITDIYGSRLPMWNSLCYAQLIRMFSLLGQEWMASQGVDSRLNGGMESEMMNSVLTYIHQHYTEGLRLDDAAAFSGFSKYYFSRAFKKFFGVSFTECLCRCRLDAAVDLLVHSRLPIREVAMKSGFGSVATFNRIFHAAYACSPSRYRALYGEK